MPLPQVPFNPNEENDDTTARPPLTPPFRAGGGLPSAPIFPPSFEEPVEEEEEPLGLTSYPTEVKPAPSFAFSPEDIADEEEEGEDLDASYDEEPASVFSSLDDEPVSVEEPDIVKAYPPHIRDSIDALLDAISSDESSEVLMNGPDTVMFKNAGSRYQVPDMDLGDVDTYHRIINEFILSQTDTAERITNKSYLIEGQMEWYDEEGQPPILARVHIVAPPVVKYAKVTIAKKARHSYTLDDIYANGSMSESMNEFLKAVAQARVTTVFSGLSGAGKTTLLEAMSYHFDPNDRIIVVEDTPELRIAVSDTVPMTTTSYKPGVKAEDVITMEWLVRATNRMRPDRIIVGEVRGGEMAEFLIAANSGADGSMTTVHAADPRRTLDKMLSLAMKSDSAKSENSVRRDIAATVQIIVQASLIDGQHIITHIEEVSNTIRESSNTIATQNLFYYDRNRGIHVPGTRPSESLQSYMAQRGVKVDPSWFMSR